GSGAIRVNRGRGWRRCNHGFVRWFRRAGGDARRRFIRLVCRHGQQILRTVGRRGLSLPQSSCERFLRLYRVCTEANQIPSPNGDKGRRVAPIVLSHRSFSTVAVPCQRPLPSEGRGSWPSCPTVIRHTRDDGVRAEEQGCFEAEGGLRVQELLPPVLRHVLRH